MNTNRNKVGRPHGSIYSGDQAKLERIADILLSCPRVSFAAATRSAGVNYPEADTQRLRRQFKKRKDELMRGACGRRAARNATQGRRALASAEEIVSLWPGPYLNHLAFLPANKVSAFAEAMSKIIATSTPSPAVLSLMHNVDRITMQRAIRQQLFPLSRLSSAQMQAITRYTLLPPSALKRK